MAGLPKKYIKRYGISKKAWNEYRKTKRRKSPSLKKRTHRVRKKVVRMAKRRYTRRYARRRSYRRTVSKLKPFSIIGYAIIGEPLIDSLAGNFGFPVDLVKVGLGYFLMKKSGIMGEFGTAMFYISLYSLSKNMLSGGLNIGNLFGTAQTTTATNW